MKTVTVDEDEWLKTKLNAERWLYIKGEHVRCSSVFMDGTSIYMLGGSLGRARTIESAVDAMMLYYGYPIPESTEAKGGAS